jgi:cytochrome c oxidase subunit II
MADLIRCRRGIILGMLVPVLAFVLAGCSGITGGEFQSANETAGDNAGAIWNLFVPIFWLSVVIFVLVQGALIYAVIKFRYKEGDPAPAQLHGNTKVEIAWTIAPAIILAVILVPTITTIASLADEPDDPFVVDVVGHQWWWEFDYQDEGFKTGNVLHLPVDQPIQVRMTASDVIHSFYAPQLFGKQDVIPGRTTNIYFTAERTGEFYGQCYEFCGIQHANMHFRIMVHEQDEFEEWVAAQQEGAVEPEPESIEALGKEVFFQAGAACHACHAIDGAVAEDGTEALAEVGPNLTNVGDRPIIGAGSLENTPENLRAWIRNPHESKPGNEMPAFSESQISDEDLDALVAYLSSLR